MSWPHASPGLSSGPPSWGVSLCLLRHIAIETRHDAPFRIQCAERTHASASRHVQSAFQRESPCAQPGMPALPAKNARGQDRLCRAKDAMLLRMTGSSTGSPARKTGATTTIYLGKLKPQVAAAAAVAGVGPSTWIRDSVRRALSDEIGRAASPALDGSGDVGAEQSVYRA